MTLTSLTQAAAIMAAARTLLPAITMGTAVDAQMLRQALTGAFHGTDAEGKWDWKTAYDATEVAAVLFLMQFGSALRQRADTPLALLPMIERIARLFPSHTRRSQESVQHQQFSTPLPLGLAVAAAADLGASDVVLEPSAGTGLLAVHAQMVGCRLLLNELASTRNELLTSLFPNGPVTCWDAANIDDYLDPTARPTVVVMNPPFSVAADGHRVGDMAMRHVKSALNRLPPGGRLVTITGAHQSPHALAYRDLYQVLQEDASVVFTAAVSGSLYARHGTTIDTRLTVIDKVPATDPAVFPSCAGIAGDARTLLSWIAQAVPARQPVEINAVASDPRLPQRAIIPPASTRRCRPDRHDLAGVELAYEVADVALRIVEREGAVYQPYVLQSIRIPGAHPHPTALVQSSAMAAVAPPMPTYRPHLLPDVVSAGHLSDAQLETVIYAGEAHSQRLGGWWQPSETFDNVRLVPEGTIDAVEYRRGFFLGDGTGAGKGRQVSGIIMDNWLKGRRRAIWVSKSDKLLQDAQRDWAAVGMEKLLIVPQSSYAHGTPITMGDGVLFTTYATLRSGARGSAKSRLEQILAWVDPTFDGVIILDEAHELQNAVAATDETDDRQRAQEPSLQGRVGLQLQHALPDARVVYVSATSSTSVTKFAYTQRLGLWGGADFPFSTRAEFIAAIESGGVGAMEVLARDLKAIGLYVARSLSFDGVEVDLMTHALSQEQIRVYDAYANAFAVIHQNLEQALMASNVIAPNGATRNRAALAAARSAFESTKMRFFNHLLTGMAVPSLIKSMEEDLAAGRAPVIQVISTGESLLERRLAEISPAEWNDLQVDVTPREYVLSYLTAAFPTQLHREISLDGGAVVSTPVTKENGQPVPCREAVRRQAAMIEQVAALPPVIGALDQIIQYFGVEIVAEVTGRRRRIVRNGHKLSVDTRPASANLDEAVAFMDDRKQVLIFSEAGGTGRSYHADRTAGNQRRRVHYLLEPGWRADVAVQGLGRTLRTNQVCAPIVRPLSTDVAAQKRFLSTIARRLDSLGALTRGQRQTGGQGLFKPEDNLESVYGRDALRQLYVRLVAGQVPECPIATFETMTGLKLTTKSGTREDMPPITTFLNRLLALPIRLQNAIFDVFYGLLEARIAAAIAAGTYDVGLETLCADSFQITDRRTIHVHPATGAETQLIRIAERRRVDILTWERAWARVTGGEGKPLVNSRTGRAAVATEAPALLEADGSYVSRLRLIRPCTNDYLASDRLPETSWREAEADVFKAAWEGECASLPTMSERTLHMVSGLLLPVWRQLPIGSSRVFRLTTDDGERIIGRQVPPEWQSLGDAVGLPPDIDALWRDLCAGTASVELDAGLRVRRVKVMYADRVEISGWSDTQVEALKAAGCMSEIISWQLRLFIPLGSPDVFADILARHPYIRRIDEKAAA